MKTKQETYDIVVCGGGLAGFCAAIAAARQGAKTCLIQDRPVFGGNSSSEIRVTPHGAGHFHGYARETGIISELLIEERARNHEEIFENGWTNSVWDLVMYDMAVQQENLTFHLNTTVDDVIMEDGTRGSENPSDIDTQDLSFGYIHRKARNTCRRIGAVEASTLNAELRTKICGKVFIDCTGDGLVADQAGCEWRMGTEGRDEFDEPHAPLRASKDTMGNSIHFKARDMGRPVPFEAPDWAVKHENPDYFYEQGRKPNDMRGGYWWIEIGVPWNTVYESEDIRHELTRHTLGIWDWIKNKDPKAKEKAANYALDWIGQVPGKRESRRIVGRYFITEHDMQNKTAFEDEIAFGGWFLDLHTPGGLLAPTSEEASASGYQLDSDYAAKSYVGPYGVPLRICIANDIDNLMMAGRNISATHAALGTIRVMATTALMGQACGLAAAHALSVGKDIHEITTGSDIETIKQALLRHGAFLPNTQNRDAKDIARAATASASSEGCSSGVAPETRFEENGQSFRRPKDPITLEKRRGQIIAIGQGELKSISICISNTSTEPQSIKLALKAIDSIWDYRLSGNATLAETRLQVPPSKRQWIDWPVESELSGKLLSDSFLRLEAKAGPELSWEVAGATATAQTASTEIPGGRMRHLGQSMSFSFRVEPPQNCFKAGHVLSGTTRPERSTNLWKSDPNQALPQYLELSWEAEQTIQKIHLTFAGHLANEYHNYPPFFRDAQTVKDYRIQAWQGDAWVELLSIEDNYQRHRIHTLDDTVSTNRIRVVVTATNGDPSAAIYEIRCY